MVSSAVYRYFPSRDDLLTRLIIDGYDALGRGRRGRRPTRRAAPAERWLAVCRAVRAWALAHPHEYALLYGSPVPGYTAPQDTVPAASRVGRRPRAGSWATPRGPACCRRRAGERDRDR